MFPIHHRSRWAWFAAAVMCSAITPALGQSAIVMEPLGGLPVGDVGSAAYDVSADGTVVVGAANRHGFTALAETYEAIDCPDAFRTEAWSINDRGDIVGICEDANGAHGFLLRRGIFTLIE